MEVIKSNRQIVEQMEKEARIKTNYEIYLEILEKVSRVTGISIARIKSDTRKRKVVIARQFVMYQMRKELGEVVPFKEIAMVFNKHHATVIHSCKSIKNGIETNDPFVMPILEAYEATNQ